ncbi:hypothetical protein [Roseisolibacter agri]|uniref:BIG2 domain-containing protein n=1 Tax=Roseisolibacter agri TaxID=2014610 RepID=A0AA37QE59_9BACT|nr:hypothetical protein [Roseisolibacter agri]GLC24630.1 hypothetical protein rosag_11430 [Roseisolibacter agri]
MSNFRRDLRLPLLVAGTFALGACHSDEVMILPGEDVRVAPASLRLTVGDSAAIRASRYDRSGRPALARFTFTNERPAVSAVRAVNDSTAIITALAAGEGSVLVFSPLGNGTVNVPVTVVTR